MKILHIPNKILSQTMKPVKTIDKRIHKMVDEMIVTLDNQRDPEGVGLAANQVGLDLALFIMRPEKKAKVTVCINPEITERAPISLDATKLDYGKKHADDEERLEGCLSVPRLWGHVERSPRVKMRYTTLENETKEETFTDFLAIIVQHEVDHLNGILFTQRILEQNQKLFQEKNGELVPFKMKIG